MWIPDSSLADFIVKADLFSFFWRWRFSLRCSFSCKNLRRTNLRGIWALIENRKTDWRQDKAHAFSIGSQLRGGRLTRERTGSQHTRKRFYSRKSRWTTT